MGGWVGGYGRMAYQVTQIGAGEDAAVLAGEASSHPTNDNGSSAVVSDRGSGGGREPLGGWVIGWERRRRRFE